MIKVEGGHHPSRAGQRIKIGGPILNIQKLGGLSSVPRSLRHWIYSLFSLKFFATLSTGTLLPCRLRVGSSASSICWPILVPQFRTVNYGLRGFSISGPRLWNTLPHDIRQSVENLNLFKNKLKTYFFQLQQRHLRLCGSSSRVALY